MCGLRMTHHVYIGFDAIDHLAYRVCEQSILDNNHSGADIQIHPLRDWELRQQGYYKRAHKVKENGQKVDLATGDRFSTEFSFTRFLTPLIHSDKNRKGPCLFMDADMLVRADITELFGWADEACTVQVVQHEHIPSEEKKIVGVIQQQYKRKNWSSLMLFPNALDPDYYFHDVNTRHRNWLHQFEWVNDDKIGALPVAWNWLEGYSPAYYDPKIVHYTRGTPDLPGYENAHYADEYWEYAKAAGFRREHNLL